jgi:transcriptional regulator with XRE-family HTH domain
MNMPAANENLLGTFLKDRRAKLDPATFGIPLSRRRTAGLRREEVAQRAHVSVTWYTWLEQGRGGAPSADVLDRIARALMRTATWDVVAWNRAATAVMTDYAALAAAERNVLRMIFCNPEARAKQLDWESVARFVVSAFRADVARAGAAQNVQALVDELCRESPEFATMWRENDVRTHGGGTKQLRHPAAGLIAMEFSSFAVDGRPDLSLVIYNPATAADAERIRSLIEAKTPASP